jgi:hypothetical protein
MPALKKLSFLIVAAAFLFCGTALAVEDGFVAAQKIESKYFDIYCAPQVDLSRLSQELNIGASDRILSGRDAQRPYSSEAQLSEEIDTLFARVCDVLDMQLYSFHGTIKVCRDYVQLNQIYRNFFGKELGTRSFYVYNNNTVYTSMDNFRLGIVAHEVAHAVISHYFVVLPSVKVQEVLAGYVEYQLRNQFR